jgi:Tol biopolymer transport system component
VGLGGLAATAFVGLQVLKPKPLAVNAYDFTRVTDDPGVEFQPAISPDGNEVLYVVGGPIAAPHVFLRSAVSAAGGAAVRLGDTTTGSESYPSWTPDGQTVRLWGCPPGRGTDGRCTWLESGKLGGAPRALPLPPRASQEAFAGVTGWSPDGSRVAINVLPYTLRIVTIADGQTTDVLGAGGLSPAWSPGGTFIACTRDNVSWSRGFSLGGSSLWVARTRGGTPYRVASDEHLNASPAWLDDRHLLFVSDRDGQRAVYVVEVGPTGVRGEPRSIPGLTDPHSISYSPASRRLAYAKFTARANVWAYPLGRSAPISIRDGRRVTAGGQVIENLDVSPDGSWIVFNGDLRGRPDLYKVSSAGGQPTALTSGESGPQAPRWSPDGREIVFTTTSGSGRLRAYQIMTIPAAGGSPVALTDDSARKEYPSWSPDGRRIAFQSYHAGRQFVNAWLLSRDSVGAPWRRAEVLSDSSCFAPDWAPDGSRLVCVGGAFVSMQNGRRVRSDLFIRNGLRPGSPSRFSRDGTTIYTYAIDQAGRRGVWEVPVEGSPARLVVAFDDPALVGAGFAVSRDQLYLAVGEHQSDIWVARLRY